MFNQIKEEHNQVWEQRLAEATNLEDQAILSALRVVLQDRKCDPTNYQNEYNQVVGTGNKDQIATFIRQQELECLKLLMGEAIIYEHPERMKELLVLYDIP